MAYGDHNETPSVTQTVTYTLSLAEYMKYQVLTAQATIVAVHNERCVDLFVTVGAASWTVLNATYGNAQGSWYDGQTFSGVLPKGNPWG
jgi:hypothetical protein